MEKFVAGELNRFEFANEFWGQLMDECKEAKDLSKNFKKQADIELDPKSFEFSNIILSFKLVLEDYQYLEVDGQFYKFYKDDPRDFSEDSLKESIKLALEKVNIYFTD